MTKRFACRLLFFRSRTAKRRHPSGRLLVQLLDPTAALATALVVFVGFADCRKQLTRAQAVQLHTKRQISILGERNSFFGLHLDEVRSKGPVCDGLKLCAVISAARDSVMGYARTE